MTNSPKSLCRFRLACILILPGLMTGLAFAQPSRARNADENSKTIHFRVMAMNLSVEDIAFVQEGKVETFGVSRSRTSEWMTFRGTEPLYFFRASTLQNLEEEDPPPRPLALFSPPGSGAWLLIFVKNSEEGEGPEYRIFPIPDRAETVEEGIRFFNLTGIPLVVNVNDETIRLASGNQAQINPEPQENSNMFLRIGTVENGEVEVLSSTVFGHRPGARISYFILTNRGRIQFQRFVDPVGPAREPEED
jgi:hypothetical protein